MTGQPSGLFGLGWTGIAALLAFGMALGFFGYPWISSPPEAAGLETAHLSEEEEADESGVAHISIEVQRANGVELRRAEVREFESLLHVTGTVSADRARVARIRPLARGVVDRVFVQLGERVETGDPLVSYDNIDLGLAIGEFLAADADLRGTRTALEVSETILARSQEMLKVEAVARTEHDLLEAEFQSALAMVSSAEALVSKFEEQLHRFGLTEDDLERLKQADDTGYHRTVSQATLHAPAPGIVTNYDVGSGEVIDPSSELITITDLSSVWVLANVNERDLNAVRVGKPVSIRVATYPGESFLGRIAYTGDTVEQETRTALVRCVASNPRSRLKLGMFATVDIPSGSVYRSLAVPSAAIQEVDGHSVVFLRRTDVEFEQREVETGLEADGWVEVSGEVSAGDRVIASGSAFAKESVLSHTVGGGH